MKKLMKFMFDCVGIYLFIIVVVGIFRLSKVVVELYYADWVMTAIITTSIIGGALVHWSRISMKTLNIILSESEVRRLNKGEEIHIKHVDDDIVIRQSYMNDEPFSLLKSYQKCQDKYARQMNNHFY